MVPRSAGVAHPLGHVKTRYLERMSPAARKLAKAGTAATGGASSARTASPITARPSAVTRLTESSSAGTRPRKDRRERLHADREVDHERAVAEVPEVVRELVRGAFGVRRIAAADLRPARDPRLDEVAA